MNAGSPGRLHPGGPTPRSAAMTPPLLPRRDLLRLAGAGVLAGLAAACGTGRAAEGEAPVTDPAELRRLHGAGLLTARPKPAIEPDPAQTGLVPLGLSGSDRDGAIYVPSGYRADRPAPLALTLHGATGSGRRGIARLTQLAEGRGIILVAPDSRDYTWDLVLGRLGPDVEFIDRALGLAFSRYAVVPGAVAVEGFSDGASYALTLGLLNGDLFSRIVAFSPGFLAAGRRRGRPRLFVSHGTRDDILPIERCGREVVREARRDGYDVRFVEFDGGHTVPDDVAGAAMDWLLARS